MTQKTWLLVANASTARIFHAQSKDNLMLVDEFSHEESRLSGADLSSDRQGRTGERGSVTRHAMEDTTPPKQVEAQRFAKELAKFLEDGRINGAYDRVYLASSPSFLGMLRGALPEHVLGMVVENISKDLTAVEPGQIKDHVFLTFGT
jgi:protein required for attachment to host cells